MVGYGAGVMMPETERLLEDLIGAGGGPISGTGLNVAVLPDWVFQLPE
jgi:hypothetical protein